MDSRALDSRSEGLGFDSQCWPCIQVSAKLRIQHCYNPPTVQSSLVYRSKVGSKVAGCCAPTARGSKVWRMYVPLPLFSTYSIKLSIYPVIHFFHQITHRTYHHIWCIQTLNTEGFPGNPSLCIVLYWTIQTDNTIEYSHWMLQNQCVARTLKECRSPTKQLITSILP